MVNFLPNLFLKIDFIFQTSVCLFWTFCTVSALQMTTKPMNEIVQSISNRDSNSFRSTHKLFSIWPVCSYLTSTIINRHMYEFYWHSENIEKEKKNRFWYHLLWSWWCFCQWHFPMQIQFELIKFRPIKESNRHKEDVDSNDVRLANISTKSIALLLFVCCLCSI